MQVVTATMEPAGALAPVMPVRYLALSVPLMFKQAGGSRPITSDGIGDVLFIAYSDNADIDDIAKYQRIRLRLQLIRNENITIGGFDGQYPFLAGVIDYKVEMV